MPPNCAVLSQKCFGKDDIGLTMSSELPAGFIRRMRPLFGAQWEEILSAWEQPVRRGLRINTLKAEREAFLRLFPHPLSPSPFSSDCFYLDALHKAGCDPLHHAGAYYMQEPSAASAVTVLSPRPGERILDICAAPGGKSTQIASALKGTGLLWSNEYIPARARILTQNIERMGIKNAVISQGDTALLAQCLPGWFDGVLVDAPCSGEGMFRKEPDALAEWSEDNIRLCAARQQTILDAAAATVAPGGRLVYSTCTFAPEEDEGAVALFLDRHPEFSLVPILVPWGQPGFSFEQIRAFVSLSSCATDLTGCRRILPHHGGEGHFVALFRRDDSPANGFASPYTYAQTDTNRKAAEDLYRDCFTDMPMGHFTTIGETVRLLPDGLPLFKGLHILSAGIAVATVCKNRLEPCHAAFLAAGSSACRRKRDYLPGDTDLTAFLHGEELISPGEKGWTAITVGGIPVGFGKCDGNRIKNRYPKGLRLI